jgi:hypothetical protein
MNGWKDNAAHYGGDGNLRARDRLCAWCREIAVFRLFERIGVFKDPAAGFARWIAEYREPFYRAWPVGVPSWPLPRTASDGSVIPSMW